jgi:hypothetical protein
VIQPGRDLGHVDGNKAVEEKSKGHEPVAAAPVLNSEETRTCVPLQTAGKNLCEDC